MNVRTVYLGLGTNLSDRHAWLDQGLAALEASLVARKSIQALSMSSRYETEAWGMAEGTPAFLNMVIGVDTDMPLAELLRVLLDIERAHGRVRDASAEGYLNRTPQGRVATESSFRKLGLSPVSGTGQQDLL